MKTVLTLLLAITFTITVNAQEEGSCGTNTIIFVSGNVSFPNGYISPGVKLGLWRTFGKVAPVVSIGYQMDDTRKVSKGKTDTCVFFNRIFLEAGMKLRVTERLFIHLYAGLSDPSCYLGGDVLLKLDEFALMGVGYKNNSVSATVFIRLNK